MTTTTTDTPKIFLTDYASYNNGTQFEFGHWVELDQFNDADELGEYIADHFAEADRKSPLFGSIREEVMITDFECFPKEFYSECSMNFEVLYEYLERVESSHLDQEVIEAFADLGSYDIEEVDSFFDALEESYVGEFNSDADFAENFAEECGYMEGEKVGSWPFNNVNWDRAAQDLMYDYSESNGHYFRSL